MPPRPRIHLAVGASATRPTDDDRHLAVALDALGIDAVALPWGATVAEGATVVIRSTWDYIDRPHDFAAWLDELDRVHAVVHNATNTLRWNMHKGYLLDLAQRGLPTVPSVLVRAGAPTELDVLMAAHGWRDAVVKPAIGGTARLTVHVARSGTVAAAGHLARLLATEDAIVQPYLPSITVDGELSIVVIAGEAQLAVRKEAAVGDWRVQSDFGGTARAVPLTEETAVLAEAAVRSVTPRPAYGRVDLVRDDGGALRILELELVEPELFFRLDPAVASALARQLGVGLGPLGAG